MEEWVILSLLYPALYAVSNIIDKFLLEKRIKNPFSLSIIVGLVAFFIALIVLAFNPLKNLTINIIFFGLLAGISYSIGYFLYFYATSMEEVSRVISMIYITPIIVSLFAVIFLNEKLTLIKYFGIIIIVLGAVLIGINKLSSNEFFRRGVLIASLSSIFWATTNIIQKYLLNDISFWNLYSLQSFGLFIGLSTALLSKNARVNLRNTVKNIHFISLSEGFNFLAAIVALLALSKADVSKVSAIGSLQPLYVLVYVIILSLFIPKLLKEILNKKILIIKLVSILLIVIGAYIITR